MSNRRVVVSGIGIVSPYGIGKDILWENLKEGRSAARPINSFDASHLPVKFYANLPVNDEELVNFIKDKKSTKTMSRSAKFAMIAAQEAYEESGLGINTIDPFRTGTSLGAGGLGLWDLEYTDRFPEIAVDAQCNGVNKQIYFSEVWNNIMSKLHPLTPLKALPNITTAHLAIKFNAQGNCQTITTACTSSAQAIGEAYRQIKHGYADVIIAGGSDSMTNPNGIVAFSLLGVLSKNNDEYITAIKPFDKRRDGFMIGEGSAIIILEEFEHCRKRGARPYAEIIGYCSTNDAYRLTDEPPDARGAIQSIKLALQEAGIHTSKVDYINAHGTGTQMNDKIETYTIKSVFGENAYSVPISSTKSMIGHLVAAAGCVEFAVCLMAIKHQVIPPTINYGCPDKECDLDYVPNVAREGHLNIVQSNSFGFGGQNVCLLIKKL
jgi:3-oxoacyl-[acyl-carrier-protein] synthase II